MNVRFQYIFFPSLVNGNSESVTTRGVLVLWAIKKNAWFCLVADIMKILEHRSGNSERLCAFDVHCFWNPSSLSNLWSHIASGIIGFLRCALIWEQCMWFWAHGTRHCFDFYQLQNFKTLNLGSLSIYPSIYERIYMYS